MGGRIILRENGKAWNIEPYEWKSASVNVAGVDAETDLKDQAGFTELFDTVKAAHHITMESTGTVYVRLNEDSNDIITVTATTPFTTDFGIIRKLFVGTGGAAVTLTVKLN